MTRQVAAAAIVHHGRLLAARRTYPADVAGGWELPGGKVDTGETAADAVVREVREELGCLVAVTGALPGVAAVKPGYELVVQLARLLSGEPTPRDREHDAVRWVGPEELDDVAWLPADRPFLAQLKRLLAAGERLAGGSVGGAVRIGMTVRRPTGPWTPAVHALLERVSAAGLVEAPRVLGLDESTREVLTYVPGRPLDDDGPPVEADLLRQAMRWLRRYHDAVEGWSHPGPWRTTNRPLGPGELICHHDFAPYNVVVGSSEDGERVVGVLDWDMAGPGTRLEDLAFAAWNWVPLWRSLPAVEAADRLRVLADAYGGGLVGPGEILAGVIPRIERSVRVIAEGQAAGDAGMLNLARVGEPERTRQAAHALAARLPAIESTLPR